ncbi:MAG: DUF374 domain-containing protein [candidate division Zixibacteria bacterium]|nr:DUF374 domain-containing protein [candidate division Zixibacteria bacterium]
MGPVFIRLLGSTWRISLDGEDELNRYRQRGTKILYAFWHNRILPLTYVYRNRGVRIMISEHSDGEIIARIVDRMGYNPVRGSTTKGGMKAARELALDDSPYDLAITPDGPRGPRQIAQTGAAYIASRGGYALAPIAVSASSAWELNSWDKFLIPKPFCRLEIAIGEPIFIDKDAKASQLNESAQYLQNRLNDLTESLHRGYARAVK